MVTRRGLRTALALSLSLAARYFWCWYIASSLVKVFRGEQRLALLWPWAILSTVLSLWN